MSELYNPKSTMDDYYIPSNDIEYFRVMARSSKSPEARAKYQKQLELLEDAVVIYREARLSIFEVAYAELPFFPFEHARVQDFVKKVVDF